MRIKLLLVSFLSIALLAACSEQQSFTKKIAGDWWPVHATGSYEDAIVTAHWDGQLGDHGEIEVTYSSKTNPSLTVKKTVFYPALSFGKDNRKNDAVRTVDLSSRDLIASKYLKYKAEDGIFYLEKTNENGTPTGEFDEGRPYKFIGNDQLQLGNVTYMEYGAYRKSHTSNSIVKMSDDSGLLPISIYQ